MNHAESYLLSCIITNGELIHECVLTEGHFEDERNQRLFARMREFVRDSREIDALGLLSAYKKHPAMVEYITELSAAAAPSGEFEHYQRMVIGAWKLRKASEITRGMEQGADPNAISEAIQELQRLEGLFMEDDEEYGVLNTFIEIQEDSGRDTGQLTGVDTGYRDLNTMTSGWNDEELIIVGARPSMGKTAFVLNAVVQAAKQGVMCHIFSLETRKKKLLKRMIAAEGFLEANKLRNPYRSFEDEDWQKFSLAIATLSNLPINIYDNPDMTTAVMRSKLRKIVKKNSDMKHLVAVDYLQLLRGDSSKNRVQELGEISRSLKLLARELHLPIIALAQLSRGVDQRQDKRPMLSDLRESGSIEQDADVIAFLYRDDYYNADSEKKNVVEVIVGKNRDGETGKVELAFLKQFNKIVALERIPGRS